MASLTIPITLPQLVDLVRQLSTDERRALLDSLLAERFEATLAEGNRRRASQGEVTDDEIQSEVDAVRVQQRVAWFRPPRRGQFAR